LLTECGDLILLYALNAVLVDSGMADRKFAAVDFTAGMQLRVIHKAANNDSIARSFTHGFAPFYCGLHCPYKPF
jgi:hypothetical protein